MPFLTQIPCVKANLFCDGVMLKWSCRQEVKMHKKSLRGDDNN